MYYTIYKITNNTNGKYYIGQHKTQNLDDGYMGSGHRILAAIKKYGKENFSKEILHVFESQEEMDAKEKELVVIDRANTYNLNEGGTGNWNYINTNQLNRNGNPGANNYFITHTKEASEFGKIRGKENVDKGINIKASQVARLSPNYPGNKIYTCPHCDTTGSGGGMFASHFDNCKHNPDYIPKERKKMYLRTCPHCGFEGRGGSMTRHIKNCEKVLDTSLEPVLV